MELVNIYNATHLMIVQCLFPTPLSLTGHAALRKARWKKCKRISPRVARWKFL